MSAAMPLGYSHTVPKRPEMPNIYRKRLAPGSAPIGTILCMMGNLLGVAVNVRMADWGLSELDERRRWGIATSLTGNFGEV